MARYGAVIDGKKGAYGVVVPDLPGCTAMGRTVDEALRNAVDAARDWATETKAAGRPIPRPRAIEALVADPEVTDAIREGGVVAMVPLLLDAGYPRTANISLDAGLLEAIDEAAKQRGLTPVGLHCDGRTREDRRGRVRRASGSRSARMPR